MYNPLQLQLGPLTFKNPITVVSGTCNFGEEIQNLYPCERLGAVFLKGLTLEPRKGNPLPRLVETPSGIINAIGLENPGIHHFIEEIYPRIIRLKAMFIPNLAGFSCEQYRALSALIEKYTDMKAVELNISCPNVHAEGEIFASNLENVRRIISDIKESSGLYVIVKIPPLTGDIASFGKACEQAGCDALSAVNTFPAMDIDFETARPVLGNIFGGLSGPAIRPLALRCVYQLFKAVRIPVIGIGGIDSFSSSLKFAFAGASLLGLGTVNFYHPIFPVTLIDDLLDYCRSKEVAWKDLIGKAHLSREV